MEEKKIEFMNTKNLLSNAISATILMVLGLIGVYYVIMFESFNHGNKLGVYMADLRGLVIVLLIVGSAIMVGLLVFLSTNIEGTLKENEIYYKRANKVVNIPYTNIVTACLIPLNNKAIQITLKDNKKVNIVDIEDAKTTLQDILDRVNAANSNTAAN